MSDRRGDWIQTYTGKAFWPLDPRPEEICIEDIAHALSLQCRYGGHTSMFYSVAEHCVLLSRAVHHDWKFWALMHDAAEAYLVDVPRPIKPFLGDYRKIEAGIMAVICAKFGMDQLMPEEVSRADQAILMDERKALMKTAPQSWGTEMPPLGIDIHGWLPQFAEYKFLDTFKHLEQQRALD